MVLLTYEYMRHSASISQLLRRVTASGESKIYFESLIAKSREISCACSENKGPTNLMIIHDGNLKKGLFDMRNI